MVKIIEGHEVTVRRGTIDDGFERFCCERRTIFGGTKKEWHDAPFIRVRDVWIAECVCGRDFTVVIGNSGAIVGPKEDQARGIAVEWAEAHEKGWLPLCEGGYGPPEEKKA